VTRRELRGAGPVARLIDRLLVSHWRAIDRERDEELRAAPASAAPAGYDRRPLVVLATVAVSLTLQEYFGERNVFVKLFPADEATWTGDYYLLWQFVWWSGWRLFGYVVLPVAAIWLMPGERLRDYGVRFAGVSRHIWIYLGLYAIVLPAILVVSQWRSFYTTYPFYKLANRSSFDFWAWQALYALQFLSLEFFFRGFILQGLRRTMGSAAIFVMMVPYCMIHFEKPMAETLGAIIAGVVLGTLALRTGSIWLGVLIHVSVALTMDGLALRHCPDFAIGPCLAK
jgi:membrane protease YdiL (CAAX protease family)